MGHRHHTSEHRVFWLALRQKGVLVGGDALTRRKPSELIPNPFSRLLATFFGSGLVPFMPGTWGSLAAALPLLLAPPETWPWVPLAGCLAATAGSVVISRQLPHKALGGDPGWFVLDEAAGLWLTALWAGGPDWVRLLLAFVAFRVFDMWKPPPVRRLERVGGGFGIVLDDLAAAGYALALLFAAEVSIGAAQVAA